MARCSSSSQGWNRFPAHLEMDDVFSIQMRTLIVKTIGIPAEQAGQRHGGVSCLAAQGPKVSF